MWELTDFMRGAGRKRSGRPSQDEYRYWSEEELRQLKLLKDMKVKYRTAAEVLRRSYQSVKAMGAKL